MFSSYCQLFQDGAKENKVKDHDSDINIYQRGKDGVRDGRTELGSQGRGSEMNCINTVRKNKALQKKEFGGVVPLKSLRFYLQPAAAKK